RPLSPEWREQGKREVWRPSRRSDHTRGDPEADDNRGRKDRQKPAEIFIEQGVDRFAVMLEENCYKEKPSTACYERQENGKRQAIGQKPAGDRHDLEGDRRQPLDKNNRPSPLRIKR